MHCEGKLGCERFLTRATGRMELPLTEVGKALSEAVLGRLSLICSFSYPSGIVE